jgi:hypothetical protein
MTRTFGLFSAAICCTLFLSGLATPALAQTACNPDPKHRSATAPAAVALGDDLPLCVTAAYDRDHTNMFQAAPGTRTGWREVAGNGATGGADLSAALLGDHLRLVTDATDHLYIKVLRPSGLLIGYRLTF